MKKLAPLTTIALFSFLGGMSGQLLLSAGPAIAGKAMEYLAFGDSQNAKGLELYVNGGMPAGNFYDESGKIRLQMGLYPSQGERGMPLISMNDSTGNIKALIRIAGDNQSPVLVMKDKNHRDRLVMGLGLNGSEAPFLAVFDDKGNKKNIFGSY